jgi:hypothetical protein
VICTCACVRVMAVPSRPGNMGPGSRCSLPRRVQGLTGLACASGEKKGNGAHRVRRGKRNTVQRRRMPPGLATQAHRSREALVGPAGCAWTQASLLAPQRRQGEQASLQKEGGAPSPQESTTGLPGEAQTTSWCVPCLSSPCCPWRDELLACVKAAALLSVRTLRSLR